MTQARITTDQASNPVLTVSGPVVELVLNAPDRKNALTLAAWARIPELLAPLHEADDVRVCVVKGAGGKAFCAGADISEFEAVRSTPDAAAHYDQANVTAFQALKDLPVPVIAEIEGPCLGGGLGLALACDLRIAASSAFFAIPAARLGLAYPPEALADLLAAVSPSSAKKLLFAAERLTAASAFHIGLIDEVCVPEELPARIAKLTTAIADNAPLSLKAAKQAIGQLTVQGSPNLAEAQAMARRCIDSRDYSEGCRAFLEKRRPVFTGT